MLIDFESRSKLKIMEIKDIIPKGRMNKAVEEQLNSSYLYELSLTEMPLIKGGLQMFDGFGDQDDMEGYLRGKISLQTGKPGGMRFGKPEIDDPVYLKK